MLSVHAMVHSDGGASEGGVLSKSASSGSSSIKGRRRKTASKRPNNKRDVAIGDDAPSLSKESLKGVLTEGWTIIKDPNKNETGKVSGGSSTYMRTKEVKRTYDAKTCRENTKPHVEGVERETSKKSDEVKINSVRKSTKSITFEDLKNQAENLVSGKQKQKARNSVNFEQDESSLSTGESNKESPLHTNKIRSGDRTNGSQKRKLGKTKKEKMKTGMQNTGTEDTVKSTEPTSREGLTSPGYPLCRRHLQENVNSSMKDIQTVKAEDQIEARSPAENKKEALSDRESKSVSVNRSSSHRSSGSDSSTLRKRAKKKSVAATQTTDIVIPQNCKDTSLTSIRDRVYDEVITAGRPSAKGNELFPPPKDPCHRRASINKNSGGDGAKETNSGKRGSSNTSMLLKLMMPPVSKDKRSSRHSRSSQSPSRGDTVKQSPKNTSTVSRTSIIPPQWSLMAGNVKQLPWFWPPIKYVEGANSPAAIVNSQPTGPQGELETYDSPYDHPQSPPPFLETETGDPRELALHVPFPKRDPPPVPCIVHGDALSVSSLSSSLAGHTYEQVNFNIEATILEGKENDYITNQRMDEGKRESKEIGEGKNLEQACMIERHKRTLSKRKRKESRSKAIGTDDSYWVGQEVLLPENHNYSESDSSAVVDTKTLATELVGNREEQIVPLPLEYQTEVKAVQSSNVTELHEKCQNHYSTDTEVLERGRRMSKEEMDHYKSVGLFPNHRRFSKEVKHSRLSSSTTGSSKQSKDTNRSSRSSRNCPSISEEGDDQMPADARQREDTPRVQKNEEINTQDVQLIHNENVEPGDTSKAEVFTRPNDGCDEEPPKKSSRIVTCAAPLHLRTDFPLPDESRSHARSFSGFENLMHSLGSCSGMEKEYTDSKSGETNFLRRIFNMVTRDEVGRTSAHRTQSSPCHSLQSQVMSDPKRRGVYLPFETESDSGAESDSRIERMENHLASKMVDSGRRRNNSVGLLDHTSTSEPKLSNPSRYGSPTSTFPYQRGSTFVLHHQSVSRSFSVDGADPYVISPPSWSLPSSPRVSLFQRIRRSFRKPKTSLPASPPPSPRSPSTSRGPTPVRGEGGSFQEGSLESSTSTGLTDPVEDFRKFRPIVQPPVGAAPLHPGLSQPSRNSLEERITATQDGAERCRLEGEVCRVQESLGERLGSPTVILRRRDHRLHTINTIEKTIQRLQENIKSQPGSTQDMDSVNANQVRDDDATTEDISEIPDGDLTVSETLLPSSTWNRDGGGGGGRGGFERMGARADSHSGSPSPVSPPYQIPPHHQVPHPQFPAQMPPAIEAVLRGTWPFEKALWHSSPASMGVSQRNCTQDSIPGIMATSSVTNRRAQSQQQLLSNKVEMVYGLLSMFSSGDRDEMSRTLLAMSSSPDSCIAMRQSGCLPLLIQLLHGGDGDPAPTRETRLRAAQALHNIVHSHPDDKRGRRESRVLRLLEQIRDYSDYLYEQLERHTAGRGPLLEDEMERHPCPAMAALMKLSFDEDHRHAMCSLGGLHAIAELIRRDHDGHGSTTADQYCITLRRYACMALTNLTFGDGTNKSLLCSFKAFMRALVSQLHSPSEDLRQVTASVLRNLSWRADSSSRQSLREVGAVTSLMQVALSAKKESTLKVILSACWNLSAHCSDNKADICAVDGALAFICSTLTYKSESKTLAIVENGGGILRNVSSHIAVREDLRQILREHNTLQTLLGQLRSPSLTVVSNACGTLWNLSARCTQDQRMLWELGAVPMLRSLINSKHKMISMGSSAALKNLLQARPEGMSITDPRHGMGLPSLQARKQRALEQELDPSLSETCDNIETSPRSSPTHTREEEPHLYGQPLVDNGQFYAPGLGGHGMHHSLGSQYSSVLRSESRDSIASTHSDNTHDRMRQLLLRHHQKNGEHTKETSSPLDLTLHPVAPPSHAHPDVAHMNFEEQQRHLESQGFTGSADEIFARMRSMKEAYSRNGSCSSLPVVTNSAVSGRCSERLPDTQTAVYSPPVSRKRSTDSNDSERAATPNRNAANGQQYPSEAHYKYYSKYINNSRNIADVNIEADSQELPVNYSLKYASNNSNTVKAQNESMAALTQSTEGPPSLQVDNFVREGSTSRAKEPANKIDKFSPTFAETDIDNPDQPTNFSLRYSEEREEEGVAYRRTAKPPVSSQYYEPPFVQDDSVKTYYTEGTPYETPYNFSTATSMTDLREPAIKEEVSREATPPSKAQQESEDKVMEVEDLEEDSDEPRDVLEPLPQHPIPPTKSGQSSGIMTPDKPVTYCVEGTPDCLSRFSSVSSLTSGEINANNERDGIMNDMMNADNMKQREVPLVKGEKLKLDGTSDERESHTPQMERNENNLENKSVHYEETPLMFSRATSVSSLSSFDVQSIHDDHSSVVSDFSRFTSGAVSPSDLPDSPSQTVPPSPKRVRAPAQPFKSTHTQGAKASTGVFHEAPTTWVEEGTPVHFSRATSLSSLTVDDDLPVVVDNLPKDRLRGDGKDSSETTGSEASRDTSQGQESKGLKGLGRRAIPKPQVHVNPSLRVPESPEHKVDRRDTQEERRSREASEERLTAYSHSDSESEDLLAACISSGMPNSRVHGSKIVGSPCPSGATPTTVATVGTGGKAVVSGIRGHAVASKLPRGSGIPVKAAVGVRGVQQQQQVPPHLTTTSQLGWGDSVRTYCTEGTPASISHAGSISDLSQLSIQDDGRTTTSSSTGAVIASSGVPAGRPAASTSPCVASVGTVSGSSPRLRGLNDSDNNSSDNDNILEQCIQSAMPKARPSSKPKEVKQPERPRHGSGHLCSHSSVPVVPHHTSPRRGGSSSPQRLSASSSPQHQGRPVPVARVSPAVKSTPPKPKSEDYLGDQLLTYATEGTPINFSTATSLSDLTLDSTEPQPGSRSGGISQLDSPHTPAGSAASKKSTTGTYDSPQQYAVEGTPAVFSRCDSLSSLSCEEEGRQDGASSPRPSIPRSKSRTLQAQHEDIEQSDQRPRYHQSASLPEGSSTAKSEVEGGSGTGVRSYGLEDTPVCFSRNSSLSSLSVDSYGEEPTPTEQALLQQCISQGMPKSKSDLAERRSRPRRSPSSRIPGPSSVASRSPGRMVPGVPMQRLELKRTPEREVTRKDETKNRESPVAVGGAAQVADASATTITATPEEESSKLRTDSEQSEKNERIEDEDDSQLEEQDREEDTEEVTRDEDTADITEEDSERTETVSGEPHDITEHLSEIIGEKCEVVSVVSEVTSESSGMTVINKETFQSDREQDRDFEGVEDEEDANEITQVRVSDESTEGLKSSNEGKKSSDEDGVMKTSDKSSPSWPSLSVEAGGKLSDSSLTQSVSESGMLALEAMRVAKAVVLEARHMSSDETSQMSQSINSVASDNMLDAMKPPSGMDSLMSLSNSMTSSAEERPKHSTQKQQQQQQQLQQHRLECRHTRKIPEMVRRALGEQELHYTNGGTEGPSSLASSCHSNLDNIAPPSLIDDDMENSMVSVDSITSEVAEPRTSPPSMGTSITSEMMGQIEAPARQLVSLFMQEAKHQSNTFTISNEEPSTYQEVTDITEHDETVEPFSETLGSDTELMAEDLPVDVPDLPRDDHSHPGSPAMQRASPRRRRQSMRARHAQAKDRYRTFTKNEREADISTGDQTISVDTDKTLVNSATPSPGRTPKQRRQEDAERFRTRTISSETNDQIGEETNDLKEETAAPNKSPKSNKSPKQRRQENPDRYQTHTISTDSGNSSPAVIELLDDEELKDGAVASDTSSRKLQGRQSFKLRRQEDKERYQTRTIETPITAFTSDDGKVSQEDEGAKVSDEAEIVDFQDSNDILDLTAEELEVLHQDANIVICTLNETREAMTSESSDLLSEENILDIETLSLISNETDSETRNLEDLDDDDAPDDDEEEEEEEHKPVLRRPRIVKPGDETPRSPDEGVGKGIRGRRKALYGSKRRTGVPTPAKAVNPVTPIQVRRDTSGTTQHKPGSPKMPRATRASALRQTSNLSRGSTGASEEGGRNAGSSPGSSNGSSPRMGGSPRAARSASSNRASGIARPQRSKSLARPGPEPPHPLRRQNTFTKDDMDTEPCETRASSAPGKISDSKKGVLRVPPKSKIRRDAVQPSPAPTLTNVQGLVGRGSNAFRAVGQEVSPSRIGGPRPHFQYGKSISLPRDSRPPNARDFAELGREGQPNKNEVKPKKEVTSRIASLWKKVEKAQNKPKDKDSRQWITSNRTNANSKVSKSGLVRSSTFEKVSDLGLEKEGNIEVSGQRSRTKLGLKLAKLRGRDTRSSPPSEVTTPVDKPHCLVSPTRFFHSHDYSGGHTHPSDTSVILRQRPVTHPPSSQHESEEAKAKRLSRLGSFIVVEGEDPTGRPAVKSPPQSAIVPPFNYQPPQARTKVPATRIPLPSKTYISNRTASTHDDNGNSDAIDTHVITGM